MCPAQHVSHKVSSFFNVFYSLVNLLAVHENNQEAPKS